LTAAIHASTAAAAALVTAPGGVAAYPHPVNAPPTWRVGVGTGIAIAGGYAGLREIDTA